jgi:mRNA interferase MazF
MTPSKRGAIVLVEFGYSEGIGSKKRPALVLSTDEYHQSRQEVIVAAITSNVSRVLAGDTLIKRWREASLLFPSMTTGILRTIKASLIVRTLGTLPQQDLRRVESNLRHALGL